MGTTNILDLNNRVDKLEKSYPAEQVMMSDGVTSVEDKIHIGYGTMVNITSYTSSNKYTAPSDGLVVVTLTSNSNDSYCSLFSRMLNNVVCKVVGLGNNSTVTSVPVLKGDQIYITHNNGYVVFYPYI